MKMNNTMKGSINKPFWRFGLSIDSPGTGKSFQNGVINEPVSENEAREMLNKQYGVNGAVTIRYIESMEYPEFSENEIIVLKAMLEWDQDYSYGYWYLEDTGLDRKTLQKCIKRLRELDLVKMSRGGINDDGEVVGGTGFYISYDKREVVELLTREDCQ